MISYFVKNGFWLLNSYALNFLIGFVLAWVYANKLDPQIFGEYTFILAILSALSIFSLPGMGQALVYSLVNKEYGNYKLAIEHTLVFSVFGTLALIITGFYYFLQNNLNLAYSLIFLSLIFPLYSCVNYYQSLLSAQKRFKLLALLGSINAIVSFVFILLTIFFRPTTLNLVIASILPSVMINTYILYKNWPRLNKKTNRTFIKLGWNLSFTFYIHFLTNSIDKILLGILLPFKDLATYAIALIIPTQGYALLKIFTTLTTPKIAEMNKKDLVQILLKKYFLFLSIIVTGIGVYFFSAPVIFKLFFPRYSETVILTQIYSLGLISIPSSILTLVFQKLNKSNYLYIQDILFLITLVIGLFLLVPGFGLIGAVWANVIGRFFYTLITLILYLNLRKF